ncbi:MAG TPA: TolC family protein [Thermoanaerobaculia bacterium]|nr:TolC family protein [Thermoanaerobaculia bacterium]
MNVISFSRPSRAALAVAGLLACLAVEAAPQGPVVSARPGQRTPMPLPAPVDGAIRLSLDRAIALAVANNQDLNVAVNAAESSQYLFIASQGIFDPVLAGFANRNHQEEPASSQLVGALVGIADTYNYGANVSQLAPWGGTFTIGTTGGWLHTNSTFYSVNPSYTANLQVTVSQPLLRNFGLTATKWLIWTTQNTRDATYQTFVRSIQTGVNNVEQAYWDLVYAYQVLEVNRESLRIAQDLNRITKIKIDVGSLAPIDITQTEVGIATAEQDIITAQGLIGDAEDRIRRQLNIDPVAVPYRIVPTDEVRAEPVVLHPDEGARQAVVSRPEVIAQAYTAENERIAFEYWSNQLLPGVNLVGSYGNAGLDGTFTLPTTPPMTVMNGLGDAYRQVTDRSFKNWSIGLNVSYPILNRYAKGQQGAAKYAWDSNKALLITTQQNVVLEVRTAARSVDTARQQIVATGKGRELAEKNLDAEKKKFDNGMTTSFQVNQVQLDLSSAKTRELQALVVYRKALAQYHYSVADNLDWKGISIEGLPQATPPPVQPWVAVAPAK